eukprot:scaffold1938_cov399-Prasinococcus_capsulatus_cf.AAC.25
MGEGGSSRSNFCNVLEPQQAAACLATHAAKAAPCYPGRGGREKGIYFARDGTSCHLLFLESSVDSVDTDLTRSPPLTLITFTPLEYGDWIAIESMRLLQHRNCKASGQQRERNMLHISNSPAQNAVHCCDEHLIFWPL